MTLFSRGDDAHSHWVRFALAEKALDARLIETDVAHPPEDLIDLNPYQTVPTLIDRDLVVYEARIVCEYLDERYPHPALLPSDPAGRAQTRVALHRIEQDWYALLPALEGSDRREQQAAARQRDRGRAAVPRPALVPVRPVLDARRCGRADALAAPAVGDRRRRHRAVRAAVRPATVRAPRFSRGLERRRTRDARMKSRRPYLLRAMHEWICDSACTPHIVVDAGAAGVEVPRHFVRDGKIILNVSWAATDKLKMTNDEVTFAGRFSGSIVEVRVPVTAVLAIYARESGQGMIFTDEDARGDAGASGEPPEPPKPASPAPGKRPRLKVIK